MTTQARIQANRLNAQKSTGPKTQKGKAAVAQNALKHGLSATQDVIITESQQEYDLHREALIEELAPQTKMESILADRIVSLSWRLKRADQIQNQTFDAIHEKNESNPFANLTKALLENRLNRPNPVRPTPCGRPTLQQDLTLGRIALKDFANQRVLDRLLMYERRIENSLHKTIQELQRLTLIRNIEPSAPKPTYHIERSPDLSGMPHRDTTSKILPILTPSHGAIAQNKPNLQNQSIGTTPATINTYNQKQPQLPQKKQTQSNPIFSRRTPDRSRATPNIPPLNCLQRPDML